ncbi:MAG TPA: hypothetical protein VKZ96_11315 [Thermomicrobiales bacterium]|nr:hypothetical protein [Thermomicrobiales bacterium]
MALLILHGLAAVFLIGALTHQAAGLLRTAAPAGRGFVQRFAAVRPGGYAGAIVVLYLVTLLLGALIYPSYALGPRAAIRVEWPAAFASFEIKEHFAALGLALLPAYWELWRGAPPEEEKGSATRRAVTLLLALIVWVAFLVGRVLNNLGGLS